MHLGLCAHPLPSPDLLVRTAALCNGGTTFEIRTAWSRHKSSATARKSSRQQCDAISVYFGDAALASAFVAR
jgi:hypothetical protein